MVYWWINLISSLVILHIYLIVMRYIIISHEHVDF